MSSENTNEGLKRVVGIPGVSAQVINFTIGVGIYALPALIALQLGGAAIIGYLLCRVMFACIMLCYVEVGSRIKKSGGSYAYVESAFGAFPGFIVNWLLIFGWGILSDAAVINLVTDSASVMIPALAKPLVRACVFFIIVGFMVLVNVRDARWSLRFVQYITIIKILPLIAIIIFGLGFIEIKNLHWEHMPSLNAFNETAIILFFAFAGFESSLNVSGEIKNPKRTIPRGILLGGGVVFLIYILIQTVTQGVLGDQLSQFKDAPLAAIAERIGGSWAGIVIVFATVVSGLGAVNGDVLGGPRVIFAGAKDKLFPKFLDTVHPRFATPHLAIIVYGSLVFLFSVSGGFKQLAILASGGLLLVYLGVVLALIKFRIKKVQSEERAFKTPGGLIIPVVAIIAILYVLSNLSRQEIFSTAVFVAFVCIVYLVMKKGQKNADKQL